MTIRVLVRNRGTGRHPVFRSLGLPADGCGAHHEGQRPLPSCAAVPTRTRLRLSKGERCVYQNETSGEGFPSLGPYLRGAKPAITMVVEQSGIQRDWRRRRWLRSPNPALHHSLGLKPVREARLRGDDDVIDGEAGNASTGGSRPRTIRRGAVGRPGHRRQTKWLAHR